MENFLHWFGTESASHFGDFLTGIAALSAVIVTARAIPHELKKWRLQERAKLQAEAAAKLQVAVIRFVQAIQHITSPLSFEAVDLNKTPVERTYERFNNRVQASRAEIEGYATAWIEGEVHLPDEIDKLNNDLWNLWISIKVEFEVWYDYASDGNSSTELKESHKIVFGNETKKEIMKIESELKRLLKPIAQLE